MCRRCAMAVAVTVPVAVPGGVLRSSQKISYRAWLDTQTQKGTPEQQCSSEEQTASVFERAFIITV